MLRGVRRAAERIAGEPVICGPRVPAFFGCAFATGTPLLLVGALVIYTNALKPTVAVVWSGMWNLIGVLVSSGAVKPPTLCVFLGGMQFAGGIQLILRLK